MFCRLLEKEVKVPFQLMVIKSVSMPAGVYLLKKKNAFRKSLQTE